MTNAWVFINIMDCDWQRHQKVDPIGRARRCTGGKEGNGHGAKARCRLAGSTRVTGQSAHGGGLGLVKSGVGPADSNLHSCTIGSVELGNTRLRTFIQ